MFVNFLKDELYEKYVALDNTGIDLDKGLSKLALSYIMDKPRRFYVYIYIHNADIMFAVPLRTKPGNQFSPSVQIGNRKSCLDYAHAVYIPKKYIPSKKETPIQTLQQDYMLVATDSNSTIQDIREAKYFYDDREKTYHLLSAEVKKYEPYLRRRFVSFLSHYCERITYNQDSRNGMRAVSTLRYFESEIKNALEASYYLIHGQLPTVDNVRRTVSVDFEKKIKTHLTKLRECKRKFVDLRGDYVGLKQQNGLKK